MALSATIYVFDIELADADRGVYETLSLRVALYRARDAHSELVASCPMMQRMEGILFTDIEGSTRLWEEHRAEMGAALARHDGILTAEIRRAGGQVLKTTGDGCIAIFESPPAAVAAALGIQQALLAETWGATGPIRVRVGVHAGDTEHRDNDYFGPSMNRAARIMAAGHGGQVLVSTAVAELAGHALPSGAALRDLGTHRLKDLTRPEHLYQLLAGGLPSEFPALRTLDARPGNLPVQTTDFFGREAEIAAVVELVQARRARLVTITGPGGTGKTRLALQVAAELVDAFRDGVFFVDLSNYRTADAAFEAVVRALDLPVSGNGGPLETLKVRLRDRQMLLVLDNFEQVIDAAEGVSDLLQHVPETQIVVTSRESLRVRAEQVYPVPPLAVPSAGASIGEIATTEAVQLFEQRGRAVRPEFSVTPENARAIAAICARLDGLPLAIELAAARLRLFTPQDLLTRLHDRLDALGAGGRDLPDRQRTLWGAIGWSYELLDEGERALFAMLSVFSTADLPAVEAVAQDTPVADVVLDALGSLVDKSLVQSRDDGQRQRFSMLQMVNEYAAARLDPDAGARVREAHARYYADLAITHRGGLRSAERNAALAALEPELGNLRVAWRYWIEQRDVERLFGMVDALWALHAARGWYHAAIDLTTGMLDVLAASGRAAEFAAAELSLRTNLARALMAVGGYNAEVEAALNRALQLAEAGGTTSQELPVFRALASIYNQRTSWEAASTIGRHLISLGERERDRTILAEGHYVVGVNALFLDPMRALGELEEAIELFGPQTPEGERLRVGPNSAILARTASSLMLWMTGALDQSVARMDEALAIARDLDHPYSLAYALYHVAFLAVDRRRFADCLGYARELATVSEAHGYPIWGTLARVLEGVARAAMGEPDEGLAMTEAAVDLYQGLTPPPAFWPFVLMLRGAVHAMSAHPERALELLDEAGAAVGSLGLDPPALRAMRGDVMRLLRTPDPEAIEAEYRRAIEVGMATGLRLGALSGATGLVTLLRAAGRTPDGSAELAAIYRSFTEGQAEQPLVAARALLEGAGASG